MSCLPSIYKIEPFWYQFQTKWKCHSKLLLTAYVTINLEQKPSVTAVYICPCHILPVVFTEFLIRPASFSNICLINDPVLDPNQTDADNITLTQWLLENGYWFRNTIYKRFCNRQPFILKMDCDASWESYFWWINTGFGTCSKIDLDLHCHMVLLL